MSQNQGYHPKDSHDRVNLYKGEGIGIRHPARNKGKLRGAF